MHLIMLFGPPAAGKMTVGREIARSTPYKLLHNHAMIEPLLSVFEFGVPAFDTLKDEFRTRVIEEAVEHGLPGLVLTFAWALDQSQDTAIVERMMAPAVDAGQPVDFVELCSSQATRLGREGTPLRLEHKASKRDVEWSKANLVEWDGKYRLNTGPDQAFPLEGRYPHLRVDNDQLSAAEAAQVIVDRLALPRSGR